MPEEGLQPQTEGGTQAEGGAIGSGGGGGVGGGGGARLGVALRRHWPVPVVLAGAVALTGALVTAFRTAEAPDFEPALSASERLIEAGAFGRAIGVLNEKVYPFVGKPVLGPLDRRRFHLLLARALNGGQLELEVQRRENDENIVGQYVEAERLDAPLTGRDQANLSRAYLALGDFERARERAERIGVSEAGLRDGAFRALVEGLTSARPPRYEQAMELLASRLGDGELSTESRVWLLSRQAQIRGMLGFHDESVTQLLRVLPRLVGLGARELAPLHLELGRAYLALGALEEAGRELERVDRDAAADVGSELRAEAVLLRAHAEARGGEAAGLESARDRYQSIVDHAPGVSVYADAMLGLAVTEGELGNVRASGDSFRLLLGLMMGGGGGGVGGGGGGDSPTREEVTGGLLTRYERLSEEGRWVEALRFAEMAGELWELTETPVEVLLALAGVHEELAKELVGGGVGGVGGAEVVDPLRVGGLDPATRVEAKRHLLRSAGYYDLHAERHVVDDFETHLSSLWKAAGLFDAAGDTQEAIRTYASFAEITRGEAGRAEARFRLGRAFQASGDYESAARVYQGLIEERSSTGVVEVGRWADASLVPLAQCYMLDVTAENDVEAESLLLRVVDGRIGGPSREEYSEALLQLGRLYYERGRFDLALERLEEAMKRLEESGGGLEDDPGLGYRIADARRRLAERIGEELGRELRGGERRELASERESHLRGAMALFGRVREVLGAKDPRRRTELERVFLRNASFYLGDCAYELGELELAIAHYTAARNRYAEEPSSLVALMQIVNAHVALGDFAAARAANERARSLVASLPDTVWDDPTLPISRDDWQAWLDSNAELQDRLAREGGG